MQALAALVAPLMPHLVVAPVVLPLAVGVTWIVNVTVLFGATLDRPDDTVHVTFWPLTVQVGLPGVVELMVRPFGTASVTVAAAAVARVPLLVTVIV